MKAALCLVFALALAFAQAKKGTMGEFLGTMQLSSVFLEAAFDAIDIQKNGKINMDDMAMHYYHEESVFAREKFMEIVDSNSNKDISKEELFDFMTKPVVTQAVWECTYVKSFHLMQYCVSDQVTAYVYLVLDKVAIGSFFSSIESQTDKDDVITIEEVKAMKSLSKQFTDKECANFMEEIGGADGQITKQEFEVYVTQEDLQNDFRACRTKLVGCKAEYNNECLKMELIDWTMNHFTEKDGIKLFDLFEDDGDDNIDIDESDIKKVSGCNDELALKFVKLMDKSGDGKVCYAEFRTYVRSPLVRLHLERDCARKIEDQEDELKCYKTELIKRVEEFHTPIWMKTPFLDLIFSFEHLDYTNNGKISVVDDLVNGHKWDKAVAEKMVHEMDGPDADKDIDLDEYMGYNELPHMVYGTADCLIKGRNIKKIQCYAEETKDVITVMFTKVQVLEFYKFYDKDNNGRITRAEVEAVGVTGEDLQNFLDEMGMGDETITRDEFGWYVRQQEFSHMIIAKKCSGPAEWHTVLLDFMENRFTQFDAQELFKKLDTNGDFELTCEDFGAADDDVTSLIGRMDYTKDKKINFMEFWLFFFASEDGNLRKTHLEKKCTEVHETQDKEMDCYVREIKNVGK